MKQLMLCSSIVSPVFITADTAVSPPFSRCTRGEKVGKERPPTPGPTGLGKWRSRGAVSSQTRTRVERTLLDRKEDRERTTEERQAIFQEEEIEKGAPGF